MRVQRRERRITGGTRVHPSSTELSMPGLNSAQDILATELKEIHSAERQLSRAMPRLIKKVSSDRLREMLEKRVEQGSTLIDQIEDVLAEMDTPKARQKN